MILQERKFICARHRKRQENEEYHLLQKLLPHKLELFNERYNTYISADEYITDYHSHPMLVVIARLSRDGVS